MPSEYKSRCVAKKYILRLLVGHQGGRNAQTMKYSCYKKPYVDFSPLMFSVRSWYKKKSPNTHLSTFFFFSNEKTQCTSIHLWGRNGISQDAGGTDFKDYSKETWNCCKIFPWRITLKIVLFSFPTVISSKYNLFRRCADFFRILKSF